MSHRTRTVNRQCISTSCPIRTPLVEITKATPAGAKVDPCFDPSPDPSFSALCRRILNRDLHRFGSSLNRYPQVDYPASETLIHFSPIGPNPANRQKSQKTPSDPQSLKSFPNRAMHCGFQECGGQLNASMVPNGGKISQTSGGNNFLEAPFARGAKFLFWKKLRGKFCAPSCVQNIICPLYGVKGCEKISGIACSIRGNDTKRYFGGQKTPFFRVLCKSITLQDIGISTPNLWHLGFCMMPQFGNVGHFPVMGHDRKSVLRWSHMTCVRQDSTQDFHALCRVNAWVVPYKHSVRAGLGPRESIAKWHERSWQVRFWPPSAELWPDLDQQELNQMSSCLNFLDRRGMPQCALWRNSIHSNITSQKYPAASKNQNQKMTPKFGNFDRA